MLTLSQPSLQIVRGFAGAVLFSFPMLMTMEMWALGVTLQPARLMLFVTVHLILLVGMASYARRDEALVTRKDARDAFAAYGVGVLAATTVLFLFGVVEPGMSAAAMNRTIAIQAAPAAFGAMVAHLELDEAAARIGPKHPHGLANSAFLMAVGALYLCSSLASTEEMMLIAHKMSIWQVAALMVFSLVMMHTIRATPRRRRLALKCVDARRDERRNEPRHGRLCSSRITARCRPVFPNDPRDGELIVRAKGYIEP